MMRQGREENAGKTEAEIRAKNLQWFYDDSLRRGDMTVEQKKKLEDCFVHQTHLKS